MYKKALEKLKAPAYICHEGKLRANCEQLAHIKEQSGAKILLALKGFAFTQALPLVASYLDGCTCSGVWEARLAERFFHPEAEASSQNSQSQNSQSQNSQSQNSQSQSSLSQDKPQDKSPKPQNLKEIHCYSPAFTLEDFQELSALGSHIIFNSTSQLQALAPYATNSQQLGLRINPELSFAPREIYSPCGRFSRFGLRKGELELILKALETGQINTLHCHALCEEGLPALQAVYEALKQGFLPALKKAKYLNLGGGQHITRQGYEQQGLIDFLKRVQDELGAQVILEPGEAVGWQVGVLAAQVVDITQNELDIALLNVSAEAHMPDTMLMPYTSEVEGAKIIASASALASFDPKTAPKNSYILGANSCLAGDFMGLYQFEKPLRVGSWVLFSDQLHYSVVKNTTFNGLKLPSLVLMGENGEIKSSKHFSYSSYEERN